jgi:hypothetical protein
MLNTTIFYILVCGFHLYWLIQPYAFRILHFIGFYQIHIPIHVHILIPTYSQIDIDTNSVHLYISNSVQPLLACMVRPYYFENSG